MLSALPVSGPRGTSHTTTNAPSNSATAATEPSATTNLLFLPVFIVVSFCLQVSAPKASGYWRVARILTANHSPLATRHYWVGRLECVYSRDDYNIGKVPGNEIMGCMRAPHTTHYFDLAGL